MNRTSQKRGFNALKVGSIWLFLLLLMAALSLVAVSVGSAGYSLGEILRAVFSGEESTIKVIIFNLRLPRLLQGVLAGVGLSVSGVLLQSVTGNDLASPSIIGVNAGAGFAVILLLSFFPGAAALLPPAAFLGAFLTTLLIMAIAGRADASKATVILAGIAVQALLNAGISFLSLLDADVLVSYSYFSAGGLSNTDIRLLWLPGAIILLGFSVSLACSGKIRLLCLGDDLARSLGVRVGRVRMLCLICASASAAAVVSFAGLLGFVGLIVPHLARRLTGSRTGPLLWVSALTGSILVLTADLLGRVLFAPSEVPVGIVMAFIGAPFFFYLLLRRRSEHIC